MTPEKRRACAEEIARQCGGGETEARVAESVIARFDQEADSYRDGAMSYAAFIQCGCMVAAQVDRAERIEEVAEAVAEFKRDGFTVRRVPTQQVREEIGRCTHEQAPAEKG